MIWLIGNKGMLGSEIAKQLNDNSINFIGTDQDVDITNLEVLLSFAENRNITWIINCAAYTAVDKAEDDIPFVKKLNINGPRNIAQTAKKIGAKLIHVSTDYVFKGEGDRPFTEEDKAAPQSVYGYTKYLGELEVSENTSEFYILRTSWLYGFDGNNFVYTMTKAMNARDSVKVVNDQEGSPTCAVNLASIIIKMITEENQILYGVYHCTDLGEITWWDFAKKIYEFGKKYGRITHDCAINPCTTAEYPTAAKRPAYSVLSKDKIQKALNITLPQWEESLELFIKSDRFRMQEDPMAIPKELKR
jgi:dTDP-4-dehydrorhamnose reductase